MSFENSTFNNTDPIIKGFYGSFHLENISIYGEPKNYIDLYSSMFKVA